MIRYECDGCGTRLAANDAGRYIVKLEIYAAAGAVDLDEEALSEGNQQLSDIIETLQSADPDEVENQTYRAFRFDVCDACRRALIERPLGLPR